MLTQEVSVSTQKAPQKEQVALQVIGMCVFLLFFSISCLLDHYFFGYGVINDYIKTIFHMFVRSFLCWLKTVRVCSKIKLSVTL